MTGHDAPEYPEMAGPRPQVPVMDRGECGRFREADRAKGEPSGLRLERHRRGLALQGAPGHRAL